VYVCICLSLCLCIHMYVLVDGVASVPRSSHVSAGSVSSNSSEACPLSLVLLAGVQL
jgi:hypothetical protein